jgi:AbrB family looped-hinge helix DNA binding protein
MLQARVSTEGQVHLPDEVREKLGIQPGDPLDVRIRAGCIVLVPQKSSELKAEIITDPVTGLPVLSLGPNAPILTSEEGAEMLIDFP